MRALLPLLLVACVAAPTNSERGDQVARALHAEERGDWLRAGELWQILNELGRGTDNEAARGLARALEAQGDRLGAARVLTGAREPDGVLLVQLAGIELSLGQGGQAEATLARACELDGRSLEARRRLADLLLEGGRAAEALPVLREAVLLAPGNGDLWSQLAVAALAVEETAEALRAYLTLSGLRPLDLEQAQVAARLLLEADQAEQFRAAEGWLSSALDQDPSQAGAWRLLARLRGRLDDEEGRLAALLSTLEADPADRVTLLSLAQARAAREEWERVEVLAWHARTLGDPTLVAQLDQLLALRPAPAEVEEDAQDVQDGGD